MADDKTKSGGSDRTHINVNEDYELRDWAEKFNVTPERLKEAVQAVGTRADSVEKHLKDGKRGGALFRRTLRCDGPQFHPSGRKAQMQAAAVAMRTRIRCHRARPGCRS